MKIISMCFDWEVILLLNGYQQSQNIWKELEVSEFK